MKRIIVLIIILAFCLGISNSVCAVPAIQPTPTATSGTFSGTLEWKVENDVLTISGNGEIQDYMDPSMMTGGTTMPPWSHLTFTNVVISEGITSIGMFVFQSNYIETISISSTVEYINCHAFKKAPNIKNITVHENNLYFVDINGVLFNKSLTSLIKYPGGRTDSEYKIPDSVKKIEIFAFYAVSGKLEKVIFGANVQTVCASAFEDADIAEIIVNDSLKTIDAYAFASSSTNTFIFGKNLTYIL